MSSSSVAEAIEAAEKILPGHCAPEGAEDPRWQAIIKVEDFLVDEPDAIWPFIVRWGVNDDEDLRTAIGVLLLEHLLEHHFERFFSRVEQEVRRNPQFADTFLRCWKLGKAKELRNSRRFKALRLECRKAGKRT